MKYLLWVCGIGMLFLSCKKQINEVSQPSIKAWLQRNLSPTEIESLDFSKMIYSKEGETRFLRIQETGETRKFLLLQLSSDTSVSRRKWIDVTGSGPAVNSLAKPSDELPVVIVVGYLPSNSGGFSVADYYSLIALMGNGPVFSSSGGGVVTGSYSGGSAGGTGGSAGGTGGSGGSGNIKVNYEVSTSNPGINLQSFLKCFTQVPDGGASYSVTIFTALPVDNDPTKFFSPSSGAVGHVFLQLTKSNGSTIISQVIGFTAQSPMQAIVSANPVPSKLVDNGGHKYNASLKMNLSSTQFSTLMQQLNVMSAGTTYDIASFNCVDFALRAINSVRPTNPLIIPQYDLPGLSEAPGNTPQGLYVLLNRMEDSGRESPNIIPSGNFNASGSHGACN